MAGLLLDTPLGAEEREYAETIHASADTLLAIVNDILDFSKIEAGRMELDMTELDVRQTVEEVADLLAERAHRAGIELLTNVEPHVPTHLQGDPARIRQVLLNLVANAVKFTERGEVVVRVTSGKWRAETTQAPQPHTTTHDSQLAPRPLRDHRHRHRRLARGPRPPLRPVHPG